MDNISLQLQGNPFFLGLPCIPSDCRSFPKSIICSQSRGRDIIFHLNDKKKKKKKKKKSAVEVTFAFKIFSSGKSLIQSGSENDLIKSCLIKSNGMIPFVAKPPRGKSIRDGPLEKLWGGGELSSRRNFFSLSNTLYEFFSGPCMNISKG